MPSRTAFLVQNKVQNVGVVLGGRVVNGRLTLRVRVLQPGRVGEVQSLEVVEISGLGGLKEGVALCSSTAYRFNSKPAHAFYLRRTTLVF